MSATDTLFMNRALELALQGRFTTSPNPNVGCVIAKDGIIVGEGFHAKAGEAHAEVYALQTAGENAQGATAYVTLEPCSHYGRTPPCADALIQAGISRVVVAMKDPNPKVAGQGLNRLASAGIVVECGLLAEQAEQINKGFLKRMRTGIPWLQLKMAASLDGRTAMASGESQWITSAQARQDVQQFRAQSSAILSTGSTVLADNPSLTVRWQELPPAVRQHYPVEKVRQPLRVIVDSQNQVTPQHNLINQPGNTLLIRKTKDSLFWPDNCQQLTVTGDSRYIDLTEMLLQLGRQQINTIWTEAGATLAGALLQANVVDELIIYMAPKLLGDNARGLCHLPGLNKLVDAPEFCIKDVQQIGTDLRLQLTPT